MYPVSGGAAPSGPSEGGDDGEGGAAQSGASVGGLQQVEAPPATDSAATAGKEVSARGKGKAPAKKPAAVSSSATATLTTAKEGGGAKRARGKASAKKLASFNVDPVVLNSLGVRLHPDNVGAINVLFYDASVLTARVYGRVIGKQFPPEVRDKLSVTGRAIWHRTYRMLCEVDFSYKCFREYHAKHRPGFIRSLPTVKVLSNSSESDVGIILSGDELLNFLSKLDSAILGTMVSFFNSRWNEATGKILGPLEGKSLSDVSCVDFTNVLDIAGVPPMTMSSVRHLKIHVSTEKYKKYNKVFSGEVDVVDLTHSSPPSPQSLPSQSESQLGSSLPSEDGSGAPSGPTHSEAVVVHGNVGGIQPIKCVDLLGVKLHPASAKLVYKLFSDLREASRTSYSRSIVNYLLEAVGNSKLSVVGRAIWCKMYRELHLYSFVSRCLSVYHYKYRPDFVRALSSIQVLSVSSDKLVQLSGAGLSDFLSKLDCAIREEVESIFNTEWDGVANRVFAELEDESLDDICCEDVINVLNVTGIPVAALSAFQRCTVDRRNALENSSRVTNEGEASGSGVAVLVHSSSSPQPQPESELPPQPEPELPPQSEPELPPQPEPESLSQPEPGLSSESESLPKSHTQSETQSGSLLLLEEDSDRPYSKFVKLLLYRGQPSSASTVGTDSAVVASPGGTGPFLPPITEFVAVSTAVEESSSTTIGGDVLVSIAEGVVSVEDELSAEPSSSFSPLPVPISDLVVASDISPPLSPPAKGLVVANVVSASMGAEDDSLSPPSSPSIEPLSSSSSSVEFSSLSSSLSSSASGLDADVSSSSSSSELLVLTREAELTTEGTVSALGVLAGESPPVFSDERLIMSATATSSVSSAAIEESSTTVSSSSFSYFRGPKKSFIMGKLGTGPSVAPTSSRAAAGPSSSVSMSSNIAAAPLSSVSMEVSSVSLVAANRAAAEEEDVGARLAAFLNRGLPPSPPPAGESSGSIRGGRDGASSSSYQGSARRGSGRKRKRRS
ncbi:hypothetical protein [Candidatus Ichthyocystis sparus]|uniref:hypothetical protein n=1 Tax=Candidatus Ichthyocystis sparus TaxID=1561004 RepID=UPI00114651B7|nr:hypothetical protein [Candidatus Ichthyocystis sparus]